MIASLSSSPALILIATTILAGIILFLLVSRQQSPTTGQLQADDSSAANVAVSSAPPAKSKQSRKAPPDKAVPFSHSWLMTSLKSHAANVLSFDYSTNRKFFISCAEDVDCGGIPNWTCRRAAIWARECSPTSEKLVMTRASKKPAKADLSSQSVTWVERLMPEFEIANANGCVALSQIPQHFLYSLIRKYVMRPEDRVAHGYPMEARRGQAFIMPPNNVSPRLVIANSFDDAQNKQLRRCSRCESQYSINENGDLKSTDGCAYHWGPLRRPHRDTSAMYQCCGNPPFSPGCCSAKVHVSADPVGPCGRFELGYVHTPGSDKGVPIVSLDCEMCYTNLGLEVTKVTLVKPGGKTIYNRLVRPDRKIIDYNTRFSGLKSDDFIGITHTLANVQNDLQKILNQDSILIGHGLENDLKALKLHHPNVIDTTHLFPHFKGLPYRRSLRSLASSYLKREIQPLGSPHDSVEDAQTALDLVMWKVFSDMKRKQQKLYEPFHA